jgi:hypothetical protein
MRAREDHVQGFEPPSRTFGSVSFMSSPGGPLPTKLKADGAELSTQAAPIQPRRLVENIFSLYLLQGLNYIAPTEYHASTASLPPSRLNYILEAGRKRISYE